MGRDKALLPLGDTTVIAFLIKRLRQVCDEIIVVTRQKQSYPHLDARVVFDVMTDTFSLGGLYSGLLQSPAQTNFVCACDMPLIAPPLVSFLFEQLADYDAVVPRIGGRAEPLCAVYAKSCLPAIHACLLDHDLRMSGWLTRVRTRFIAEKELRNHDPELHSFLNLNTETDYHALLGLIQEKGGP